MTNPSNVPSFPLKMSREERKSEKMRAKDFELALKAETKGSSWKFARGNIFRENQGWFVSNMPSLAYGGGVISRWARKPMALDRLFWEIVGLPENKNLPLSFRDQGAWVLRPKTLDAYLAADTRNPEELAHVIFEQSNDALKHLSNFSTEQMLAEYEPLESSSGSYRTISVCLLILLNRPEEALALCDVTGATESALSRDSGGFTFGSKSALDAARDWIVRNREA